MTELEAIAAVLAATLRAGTPLVFAAIGELVVERAGVLNLGVEGMMLVGAVAGFSVAVAAGDPTLGVVAGAVAGAAMAAAFGLLTLTLRANQVATGLALTIFGVGLSAFAGLAYIGTPIKGIAPLAIPGLSDLPVLGTLLFGHDALVYLSVALAAATAWFINRTRAGLVLRAVGESHDVAHAMGYPVIAIRYAAVLFGGAMGGLAGAYLSLVYTPTWVENMTAGRGWIALALVVFATWRPGRVLAGAWLFGGVTVVGLHAQATGLTVSPHLLATLPYLATVVVLVLLSRKALRARLDAPAALGRTFDPPG